MKRILILLYLAIAIISCTNDYIYDINTLNKTDIPDQTTNNKYVTTIELNAVLSDLLSNDFFKNHNKSNSRTDLSSTQITTIYRDDRAIAYIANFPNESGYAIISGTKNYFPILAYNNTGSFELIDEPNHPSMIWLESITEMLEEQTSLPLDSLNKYHDIWQSITSNENSASIKIASRASRSYDYDYYKLQTELQDSVSAWMTRPNHDIIPAYGTLTGDYEIDNLAWEESKQSIWPLFENEWEQLTIGLRILGHNTSNSKIESIKDNWSEYYNKSFPLQTEYDEDGNSTRYVPRVGSGALAAGRIMHYYKYPNYINWDRFDEDDSYDNEYISSFLYHLCSESKATFGKNHTIISCYDLYETIKSYGYDAELYSKFNKNTISKNIPCILYGTLKYTGSATYTHYVIVSGYSELYYEDVCSIWTFTDPHWFRECWTHHDYFGYVRYKVNWCRNSFNNDGWFDLNASMSSNRDNPKSINFTAIITLSPKR